MDNVWKTQNDAHHTQHGMNKNTYTLFITWFIYYMIKIHRRKKKNGTRNRYIWKLQAAVIRLHLLFLTISCCLRFAIGFGIIDLVDQRHQTTDMRNAIGRTHTRAVHQQQNGRVQTTNWESLTEVRRLRASKTLECRTKRVQTHAHTHTQRRARASELASEWSTGEPKRHQRVRNAFGRAQIADCYTRIAEGFCGPSASDVRQSRTAPIVHNDRLSRWKRLRMMSSGEWRKKRCGSVSESERERMGARRMDTRCGCGADSIRCGNREEKTEKQPAENGFWMECG